MLDQIIPAIITSIVSFFSVYFITPFLIQALQKRNLVVKDYHRKDGTMIPRPGGPSILIGIIASELVLYAFFPTTAIITIMVTTILAFVVGIIDDKKSLGGWFKPLGLAFSAIPIILLGAYDTDLIFPLFGTFKIPVLYLALILFIIPITGNTINSIDVLNGVASGFMTIASFSLSISLFITQNYEIAIASLPLGCVSLAFYKYHKFPSKIFPGDSGALTLGAMYGAIAILGHAEIVAAIALLPAVVNSFLFLSSVKRIVEHRQIKNPTAITSDFKLVATQEKDAPVTLLRLILSAGPMTEQQIAKVIFKLALFSGVLAIITAIMMEIRI
jgi:UDP-N-acetylglucosamine--dolichyl-phosphate N-acetylglucosaminephosphotransferase